jgi:hypothetical protein
MTQGQDFRSKCGNTRIHYDPQGSPSKPFEVFANGTALIRFATLDSAKRRLTEKGFRFSKDQVWK